MHTAGTNLLGGGKLYTFSHVKLGELGRLRITPHGPAHILASAEVAPGDPDAPDWEKKFRLLDQVVTMCLNALPGGREMRPLPTLEEVREQRRLYRRFIGASHSVEMFELAKSLSEAEYQQLLHVAQETLVIADPGDQIGIKQRLDELQFYWNDLQERPSI